MVTALNKEAFDPIKKESVNFIYLFILSVVILKIAFFKDDFVTILRVSLSLFWLFAIPGYLFMLLWLNELGFIERLAIGVVVSTSIIGISSYYLGLAGLNIKHHTYILPLILSSVSLIIYFKKRK